MDSKSKIKGSHLREIRKKILGLSQKKFTEWLYEHGAKGNFDNPYDVKTIAAWESGRRNIPSSILRIIHDNVDWNGHQFRWEYLNGEDGVPTEAFFSADVLKTFSRIQKEVDFATMVIPGLAAYMTSRGYDFGSINNLQHFSKSLQGQVDAYLMIYMDKINETQAKMQGGDTTEK